MTAMSDIVDPVERGDSRRATGDVHARVRELIYSGALPAGTVISQVQLSQALGVSRTPLREAIRMLQEEGLIEAEPNRRGRVAGFNAQDVDSTYGSRIMLEALGMTLTLPKMSKDLLDEAHSALEDMETDTEPGVNSRWHESHHRFHSAFTAGAPEALQAQLRSGSQRADRYVRQLAVGVLAGWTGGRDEHHRILRLVMEGDHDQAILATCQHFARTVVTLLAEVAPEYEPAATRAALGLIAKRLPSAAVEGTARLGSSTPAN